MLPAVGLAAAAGGGVSIDPPSAAPSGASLFRHSGNLIGVQWTNGDASASTEVRYTDTSSSCPATPIEDNTVLKGLASPGETTFETQDEDTGEQCSYFIAHKKGGVYSAWVQVTDVLDGELCTSCPT